MKRIDPKISDNTKQKLENRIYEIWNQDINFDDYQDSDTHKSLWRKIVRSIYKHEALVFTKVAAVLIILITSSVLLYNQFTVIEEYYVFNNESTPKTVALNDGSEVILNRNSSLYYTDKKDREVTLKGEAFFKIVKDSIHPFKVKTDSLNVMVYGTQFNVYAYQYTNEINVSLFSGKVAIQMENGIEEYIVPNEEFVYNFQNAQHTKKPFNHEATATWRNSKIVCENESLEELLQKLENYYNVSFSYNSSDLKDQVITGVFDIDKDLSRIFKVIEFSQNIKFNSIQANEYKVTVE
ncbi:FecR family protein [Neptunitalea lumnitzerae]|nr:FecR domain-containing protein [Neptunitalea sp. Y10]